MKSLLAVMNKTKSKAGIAILYGTIVLGLGTGIAFVAPCSVAQAATISTAEGLKRESGNTYIPVRKIYEQLGYDVFWESETSTARIEKNGDIIDTYRLSQNENAIILIDDRMYININNYGNKQLPFYNEMEEGVFSFIVPDSVNIKNMVETLEKITKTPRMFGEPEIEPTRKLIIDTFTQYGYQVELQAFTYTDDGTIRTGYNIIASKKPQSLRKTDDIIIIGAHYDSVKDCPGANDNGSGVAVLLELARLIKDVPSDVEVRFVAFDGEEFFLQGSHYYASNLSDDEISRTVGMINFDMFAAKEIDGMYMGTFDGQSNFLTDLFDGFELIEKSWSDHASFVSLAIPTMQIGQPQPDSHNHQPDDTIEYIDENKLFLATTKGLNAILHIMSDITPSLIRNDVLDVHTVYKINLQDKIDFSMDAIQKDVFEKKYGITKTHPIPVKTPDPMTIQSVFSAMVDWFGKPLETQFVYGYSYLQHVIISMDSNEAIEAVNLLDSNMTVINDVGRYEFVQQLMGDKPIDKAWKDGLGTGYILSKNDSHYELRIMDYRGVNSYGIQYMTSQMVMPEHKKIWETIKPLFEQVHIIDDVVRVDFIANSYNDDLTLEIISEDNGLRVVIAVNEFVDVQGRIHNKDDLLYEFAYAYANNLFNHDIGRQYVSDFTTKFYSNDKVKDEFLKEMAAAFATYATDDNRENIDINKIKFFTNFSEFDKFRQVQLFFRF